MLHSSKRYWLLSAILVASMASMATALSATSAPTNTLGAKALQKVVTDAARKDTSVDLTGIVWLEHVNLVVGSKSMAETFYLETLGLTKDLSKSFHVNLGQHLAETGDPAQKVTGSIGLVVPNLSSFRDRISNFAPTFDGTQFCVLNDSDECITLTCPWGNVFHLYDISSDDSTVIDAQSPHKMVNLHADGGSYGPHRMAVRGNPGIRFIEITCRVGTTGAIANFYKTMLGCTGVSVSEDQAVIPVGPGVHLVFSEDENVTDQDFAAMQGVHICIYANDFEGLYQRLSDKNLIWTNPRFTHLDSCDTWEEALASRTLRFKDIIDLDTGEKLLELEHETRPLKHGQFLKVPHYLPK